MKGHVIAVADYDGDGRDDLALQHTKGTTGATDTVTVLTGNRTATLVSDAPQLTFSTAEFSN